MNPRNTIILLVILIALLAFVYATEPGIFGKPTPTATPRPNEVQVFKLDPARVNRIVVQDTARQLTAEVAREGDTWRVIRPVQDEGDGQRIKPVIDQVADLQATRKLEGTPVADLTPFGLVTTTYGITISLEDGSQATLRVGDKNPQGTAYYVQKGGDPAVYLVSSFNIEGLTGFISNPPVKPTPTATWTPMPTTTATPMGVAGTPGTPALASTAPGGTPTATGTPPGATPGLSTTQPPLTASPALTVTATP
jgi:hypothetical protein